MAADCPGTALCDEGSFASQKGVISDTSRRINRPEDCGVSANGQVGVCGARIRNGITWSPDSQHIIYVVEAPDFEELEQAGLMKIRVDGDMPTQFRTDELQNWMNPVFKKTDGSVMQLVGVLWSGLEGPPAVFGIGFHEPISKLRFFSFQPIFMDRNTKDNFLEKKS